MYFFSIFINVKFFINFYIYFKLFFQSWQMKNIFIILRDEKIESYGRNATLFQQNIK